MVLGRRGLRFVAFFTGLVIGVPMSFADITYPMTSPEKGKFIVEYVYNYTKQAYSPAITFRRIEKTNALYDSAENVFFSQFSAMYAQDYDWWLSGWDDSSKKEIAERNVKMNRTADDWKKIWAKGLSHDSIKLISRVETGAYVFIIYKMFDKEGKMTFESTFACKKVGEKWLATQELGSDPMFHHFQKGKDRIILNVR